MDTNNKKRVLYLSLMAVSFTCTIGSMAYGRGYKRGLNDGYGKAIDSIKDKKDK